MLCLLFFVTAFSPIVWGGTFTQPSSVAPIQLSISNRMEYSDYTFNIIPDTQIPVAGTLEITFPSQFSLGLGITINPNSNNYCSVPCSVTNYIVTMSIQTVCLPGVTSSFTVYSVLNPPYKGGTGNFVLRSRKGVNVLDENLVFGVVGIADSVNNLTSSTVALDSSGSSEAGVLTKYSFSFKTNQLIPQNSYFMITVPATAGFTISKNPSCSSFAINGNQINGNLACVSSSNQIIVNGLSADIPSSFEVGISVSLTNPTFSGTTSTFQVAILKTNTTVVHAWSTGIQGVTITPGAISKIVFALINPSLVLAMDKYMEFRLVFIPKNPLISGSEISIEFPMASVSTCYIEYGVDDIDPDSPTPCAFSGNTIIIQGFKPMTNPGEISLTTRMTTLSVNGVTTPVKIYTYYYKNSVKTIIDQDVTTATLTVAAKQSTNSPLTTTITSSTTDLADGNTCSLTFSLIPTVTVSALSYIQVVLPDGLTVNSLTASDCMIGASASLSCSKTDQVILMQIPSTLNLGITTTFSLNNNKILKPLTKGDYLIDITTFLSDATTVLESYTVTMTTTADYLTSASYTMIGSETGKTGILQVDFTPKLAVPAGIQQTTQTDIKGIIRLKFNGWSITNLGMGISTDNTEIPCTMIFGILPLAGMQVGCYLYPSSTTIEIRNFQSLSAATNCRLFIPNIISETGSIDLDLIKRYNRIDLVMNTLNVVLTAAVASVVTPGSRTSALTFGSSDQISTVFSLSFNMDLGIAMAIGDHLLIKLPTYDIGFLQDPTLVTCFLYQSSNAATPTQKAYECIKFPGIDWILVQVTNTFAMTPTTNLEIKNLKWPRYKNSAGTQLSLVHYSNFMEVEIIDYFAFTALSKPTISGFLQAKMNIPKKGKGYPDCSYYFKFKAENAIPDGGSVILTFPSDYSLQSSFPSPQFAADQFSGYNGNPLVFTPSANILTISNIAFFPAKSLFTISVKAIQNPSPSLPNSEPWTIQTNYNGNPINLQSNFDYFQYGDSYTPGTIIFNSVKAFPQNANVMADYTIEFTPGTAIPALGIISIKFPPAQYSNLPSSPHCLISGGLQTFSSISVSGTSLTIVTDSDYSTGSIIFTIHDVSNPAQGETDGFEIFTFYDNNFLDTTDTSDDSYRTVTIMPEANPLTLNSIDFEPKNEGEKATYSFTFIPTTAINRSMEIMIQFPENYDDLLGTSIECVGTAGLIGDLTVSISQKTLYITGLEAYTPSNDDPITIVVYNVINPNRISSLGNFRISTFLQNTDVFIDYNEDIEGMEMVAAAGWLSIYNVSADDYYARLMANYTLNFSLSKPLPNDASKGKIIIAFPSQFDIPDKSIGCSTTNQDFGDLSCYVLKNKVYASGNTNAYVGSLITSFLLLDNPPLSGSTSEITIMTYDGFNKYIIERSFPNLDPFSYNYSYSGPLILVNNDEDIIVERGTQSDDVDITLDYPCALNLNFSTTVTTLSLFPSVIQMKLGDLKSTFRVTVPVSLTEGNYYIIWVTTGDQIPPIYTPLKKTRVVVTNLKNVPIDLSEISNIPYGGSSLEVSATVTYSPNIGIELVANLDEDYAGVSLSKKNIIFSAGDLVQTFQILYSNDSSITNGTVISKGGLSFILSGVNKDTYTLSSSHLDFVILSPIVQAPALTELVASEVGQTYAYINIGANEISMAYYMVALTGTTQPDFTEVFNQGPIDYTTTQKQYGAIFIGSSNRVTITVSNLYAQTPYTIYVYLKNRGLNINKIKTVDFVTADRYPPSEFTLQFLQAYLNKAEKQTIISACAFVLSMPPSHIYEKNYTITSRFRDLASELKERKLASTETASTTLTLWMFSVTNSANYPTPYAMASLLNNKTDKLNSLLSNFDTSFTITVKNFTSYTPAFVETPTVPTVDQFYVVVSGKLDNYGFIYGIAVNASEDKSKPSSFQIYQGFSAENLPFQAGYVEASESFSYFTFTISNLTANTQYNIYITAGSVAPGVPDLIADKDIVLVAVQTKPLIVYDPLDINEGGRLKLILELVILAVVILENLIV